MMEAKAKAQLETLKLADDRRKRTKAMPPPLCSVQTPSSPLLHPADARTSSVIPPALPAAPRPKQIELVLSNTERDHFRTVYGQESRRTTLSPTITPPPQSIPQAKYISTAEVTASKKRFYSKCLPPAATQVNPLTPKPEILPETTSRNDTPDFPRAQKRAKKSHRKLEAWQLDPARH
ncbi:hypothetical protein GQ44DRAFT_712914 [Phaeosphaeriaceae sp. PMI808]|nr:hypothetical protein GQ44DRAFT_712914 [Phaeosphaeriaceae sp. PMI808]